MNKVFGLTRSLIILIFFFCALLVFLIWNQLKIQMTTDREESIEIAVRRNSNLAVSLEQYAIRTIKTSDAFLQLVKMEFERNPGDVDLTFLLNKGIIDKRLFASLAILNEQGKVVFSDLLNKQQGVIDLSD